MKKPSKLKTPSQVPREEFNRILGNLTKSAPVARKDAKTGEKKKGGTIIPPTPSPER